jgi:hypothetical protein
MTNQGSGYTAVPLVSFTSSTGSGATALAIRGTGASANKIIGITLTNPGSGYQTPPTVNITGGNGVGALAVATIDINIDKSESFGDNNKFKTQAADVLFSVTNPFGEVDTTNNP